MLAGYLGFDPKFTCILLCFATGLLCTMWCLKLYNFNTFSEYVLIDIVHHCIVQDTA